MVFLFFRYREQIAKGNDAPSSLDHAVTRVAEVVTSAAATVMAAFAALLVATMGQLRTLAPGLIVGVFLMLLAALTLVPAVCSLFGIHLFWPTAPKAPNPAHRTRSERIANAVSKHPAIILMLSVAILVGLALGMLNYKVTYDQLAELPSSTPSTVAFDTMASAFPPGYLGPTEVFITSSTTLSTTDVTALETKLASTTGVASVIPAQYADGNHAAMIQALLTDNPYSNAAIADLSGPIRSAVAGSVPGATVVTGGATSQLADAKTALRKDTFHILPLALVIVVLILALLLRAIAGPIYLLVGVLLAYGATLGAIVLIFINGFGFVGLDFTIPITVYIFVIAVGTDYNILIASRLREEFNAGDPPRVAARTAVVHGAPAVGAAGLILAASFASLLLTGIQLLEEIGLAVAFGVLLTSNILATRIVPTLAALKGFHFWWPHHTHTSTAAAKHDLLPVPIGDVPVAVGSSAGGLSGTGSSG